MPYYSIKPSDLDIAGLPIEVKPGYEVVSCECGKLLDYDSLAAKQSSQCIEPPLEIEIRLVVRKLPEPELKLKDPSTYYWDGSMSYVTKETSVMNPSIVNDAKLDVVDAHEMAAKSAYVNEHHTKHVSYLEEQIQKAAAASGIPLWSFKQATKAFEPSTESMKQVADKLKECADEMGLVEEDLNVPGGKRVLTLEHKAGCSGTATQPPKPT